MRIIVSLLFVFAMVAITGRSTIAQSLPQPPRVGILVSGTVVGYADSDSRDRYAAFLSGLRELGYVQGRNIIVELREAKGKLDLLPVLAAELVSLKVAAIVSSGSTAIEPAIRVTKTIPIVMIVPRRPSCAATEESLQRRHRPYRHGAVEFMERLAGWCRGRAYI